MRHPCRAAFVATALAALAACATTRGPVAVASPGGRAALQSLLAEHWEYYLRQNPEEASVLGDLRFNDQSSDFSAAAVAADLEATRRFRDRLVAIDPAGIGEQEALTRTLLLREFDEELEAARFEEWKMPVDQLSGLHLYAAQLPGRFPFRSAQHYADYATRLRRLPRQLDDTIANMRLGLAAGLMPPRFLLEKVASQADGIAAKPLAESPFTEPLRHFPDGLAAADREPLTALVEGAVREAVQPAYRRFAAFVRDEYAPRGRAEPGVWALPDGAARYAMLVRRSTTARLTPDELHDLGLAEVARIEGEMAVAARRAGFPDLAALRTSLPGDRSRRATSRAQILDLYRSAIDAMRPELPRLFGRLPRAELEVVAIEPFREKEAPGAMYKDPAADGSRPGRVEVNTGDFAGRTLLGIETTAYHEGIPGHHLQIALQAELEELPPQRRFWLGYNAYGEGWALYAERLGREVGRFQDPYSYYGHLQEEMLRAIRLVVDTGLHARRWPREEVVRYFRAHSTIDDVDVQAETDRYIVWPGQALGYKVGQLRILALRQRAAEALGPAFDLRAFHDLVLGAGSLPLDVLEARVDAWITARRAMP
jgi:uncharacterized protein (DUF885 family)